MISYSSWVSQARQFCLRLYAKFGYDAGFEVQPPLSAEDLNALNDRLDLALPPALSAFLMVTGGLAFNYAMQFDPEEKGISRNLKRIFSKPVAEVWGGGTFCSARHFCQWRESTMNWAKETWVAEDTREAGKWLYSLPIYQIPNGDYLGLELSTGAVLYLSHDDLSWTLAPTFSNFLAAWAGVCYVGPESWMLEPFLNNQLLDASTRNAARLRKLLA